MLYHGTPGWTEAQAIIEHGLRPSSTVQGRDRYAPMAGRSYLSPRLGDAMHHAMTESMHHARDGWLLVFGCDGLGDVQPDEDSVAEFLFDHARTVFPVPPDEPGLIRLPGYEIAVRLHADTEDEMVAARFIADRMTPRQLIGTAAGRRDQAAAGGKRVLKAMPPEMREWLLGRPETALAITGTPLPTEAWRIDCRAATARVYAALDAAGDRRLGAETWQRHRVIRSALEEAFDDIAMLEWRQEHQPTPAGRGYPG